MAEPADVLAAFGARVADLRRQRGMSQVELASESGLDRVTISRVERGLQDLGVVRVVALADALGCPTDALFDGLGAGGISG